MTSEVFISYSRQDKARVLPIIERLRQRGISVWIDHGSIEGATMWSEEIVEAIEACKTMMLVVTAASVSSHNVVKEVSLASERKKHILPVYLEAVELPKALKYPLAGIQHIEHFSDDEANFDALIRALTRLGVSLVTAAATGGTQPKLEQTSNEGPKLLAVLPFDNISPEKESDYFSDGLTEELIANLSKLSEIKVVSRTTTMQYKETKKDSKTIGRELGSHYILEGSVRKIGDNLRITAQLIEVSTDAHMWAETYKGTMADVFDIQEKVAKEIVDALKLKLTPVEKIGLTKRATIVPEAYECGLRAKRYLEMSSRVSYEYAVQLYERAIELDPKYAEAHAGLARTLASTYQLFTREESLLDRALDCSLKALMYDPGLADAYVALAYVYLARENSDEAVIAGRKAVEFDPDNAAGHQALGRIFFSLGRTDEATEAYEHAARIEPEDAATLNILEMCYEKQGETAKALAITEKIIAVLPAYLRANPDDARGHMTLAVELAKLGRGDEAREQSVKALQIAPNNTLMLYFAACLYARLGDGDLAVNALRSSIETGWRDMDWLKRDTDLDSIREHPAYIKLMEGH